MCKYITKWNTYAEKNERKKNKAVYLLYYRLIFVFLWLCKCNLTHLKFKMCNDRREKCTNSCLKLKSTISTVNWMRHLLRAQVNVDMFEMLKMLVIVHYFYYLYHNFAPFIRLFLSWLLCSFCSVNYSISSVLIVSEEWILYEAYLKDAWKLHLSSVEFFFPRNSSIAVIFWYRNRMLVDTVAEWFCF